MAVALEPSSGASQAAQNAVLDLVADGMPLVGTINNLACSLGLTVKDLRLALRELLEAERIAVYAAPHGQMTIRLERRAFRSPPPLAERRRPRRDIWIF